MAYFVKKIRRTSVRARLLAAFLFISLVPTAVVGIYAYNTHISVTEKKLSETAAQTARLLNGALTNEFAVYRSYIDFVSVMDEVQSAMTAGRGGQRLQKAVTWPSFGGDFKGLQILNGAGQTIYISGYANMSRGAGSLIRRLDESSPGDCVYKTDSGYLTIGRKIYRYPSGIEHIGYILVMTDPKLPSSDALNGVSFGSGGISLMAADGAVVFGDERWEGTEAPFKRLKAAENAGASSFAADSPARTVVFNKNDGLGFYLLLDIPASYIKEETRTVGAALAIFVAFIIVLGAALSALIYKSVADPISAIVARVSSKDGSKALDDSSDELGLLARSIERFTADLEKGANQRRELELTALRYQINPHFLINTLNTLKWIAVINDSPPIISQGITSLMALLRSVLTRGGEMIPLKDEIENLRHYFDIQRIRYADCFTVAEDVDESAGERLVPRLILQPLAENAVLHGSVDDGRRIVITIRARVSGGRLMLEVSDDGRGFDKNQRGEGDFSGIGLKNVNERLRLHYGDGCGLNIESGVGKGTTCRVVIPNGREEM